MEQAIENKNFNSAFQLTVQMGYFKFNQIEEFNF